MNDMRTSTIANLLMMLRFLVDGVVVVVCSGRYFTCLDVLIAYFRDQTVCLFIG